MESNLIYVIPRYSSNMKHLVLNMPIESLHNLASCLSNLLIITMQEVKRVPP